MTFEFDATEPLVVDWPVVINVPMSGGTVKPHKVTVKYKLLDAEKLKQQGNEVPARTVLEEHVVGLGPEFVDKTTGHALAFNAETLKALLAKPWIQRAFSFGLVEASSGAAAKNL